MIRTIPIIKVKTESPTTKTFIFYDKLCAKAKPGQFLMFWIPRVDEIPLSIMNSQNGKVSVTVKAVGTATKALHRMKKGQIIGIRGPFGNWFTTKYTNILLVGGGTGIAPLYYLLKKLAKTNKRITFIIGAKTKNELLLMSSIKSLCKKHKLIITTEDGSSGLKCLITKPLKRLFDQQKFDMIYACGPERMIRNVFDLAKLYRIRLEVSLERLIRCGIGICGSCLIGKYRVCRDGPIFNLKQLQEIQSEFGFLKLDFYGKKIPI